MDEVGEKLNWLCVNRNNKGVSNYRFNAVAGGIDAAILRDIEEKHYELVERYENEHRLRLIEEGNIAPLRATIEAKDNRIAALERELACESAERWACESELDGVRELAFSDAIHKDPLEERDIERRVALGRIAIRLSKRFNRLVAAIDDAKGE